MRSLLLLVLFAATARADGPADFFESKVRPLLVAKCNSCHGGTKSRGGLKLDTRAAVLAGGETGPAAVPGKPADSLMMKAVRRTGDLKMPPETPLAATEVAVLDKWITDGLTWPAEKPTTAAELWSLKPRTTPTVPEITNHQSPITNAIDRFILAKLHAAGRDLSPPADPRTLVRRLSFDLTGLPPTPEAVETFAANPTDAAYRKLVDAYLASPAYGERWGRHWLDLVRYCDSFDSRGMGSDGDCADAWRYRDWVVKSLNADMPYDRFVRMQIAGDILAPGPDGITATGMLALGNWGGGDADKEKLLTDIVDDQVDVVGRSILGLTLACARCHDHKFDPVSTKDYYSLAGVFFSTHILPGVGAKTGGPSMLRIPVETADNAAKRARVTVDLRVTEEELAAKTNAAHAAVLAKLKAELPRHLLAAYDGKSGPEFDARWLKLAANPIGTATGTILGSPAENLFDKPGLRSWRGAVDPPSFVVNGTGAVAKYATITLPAKAVAVHPGSASDIAVVWTAPTAGPATILGSVTDFDTTCGDGVSWDLRVEPVAGGRTRLEGGSIVNGGREAFTASVSVSVGDRVVLVIKRKAAYECDTTGIEFLIRGGPSADFAGEFLAAAPPKTAKLGPWSVEDLGTAATLPEPVVAAIAKWNVAKSSATRPKLEAAAVAFSDAVVAAGGVPFVAKDSDDFYSPPTRAELERLRREVAALQKRASAPKPTAHGAQEGGVPASPHAGTHDVSVHIRGRYDRLGERVPRGFPTAVKVSNAPAIRDGSGRKELADWLTRPDHPLTSRVIANRVWQYHFGEGLVRTPSNFGRLGEQPTHPELLDFLANKLIAEGWSLKQLHRDIVTSATYRQSTGPVGNDPENRLWGRYPRQRLEAEAIRDAILAVAGTLDNTSGGPAAKEFTTPRRTLYLNTVRSDRTGFGPLFDAADPTAPVDKRTVSTVAPQALFLMNHPFVRTQAEAFAKRVQAAPDAERLAFAHRLAFGRPPTDAEKALGSKVVAARGWPAWCHLLFQANEFVTIE